MQETDGSTLLLLLLLPFGEALARQAGIRQATQRYRTTMIKGLSILWRRISRRPQALPSHMPPKKSLNTNTHPFFSPHSPTNSSSHH